MAWHAKWVRAEASHAEQVVRYSGFENVERFQVRHDVDCSKQTGDRPGRSRPARCLSCYAEVAACGCRCCVAAVLVADPAGKVGLSAWAAADCCPGCSPAGIRWRRLMSLGLGCRLPLVRLLSLLLSLSLSLLLHTCDCGHKSLALRRACQVLPSGKVGLCGGSVQQDGIAVKGTCRLQGRYKGTKLVRRAS